MPSTITLRSFHGSISRAISSQTTPHTNPLHNKSAWRQLVKPFLLKCHPDMAASQDTTTASANNHKNTSSNSIKQTNLKAIQNLNFYLDTIQTMIKDVDLSKALPDPHELQKQPTKQTVPILFPVEFVVLVEDTASPRNRRGVVPMIWSRRQVELIIPTAHASLLMQINDPHKSKTERMSFVIRHVVGQLSKLLRIAGLEIPAAAKAALLDPLDETMSSDSKTQSSSSSQQRQRPRVGFFGYSRARKNANRRAFVDSIDWNKVNRLYAKSLYREKQRDLAHKVLQKNPHKRHMIIADILARVQVQRYGPKGLFVPNEEEEDEEDENNNKGEDDKNDNKHAPPRQRRPKISMAEELIAFRRLSLILEDNFEELQLHNIHSVWWEKLQLVLTPKRKYNTSSSALHKRLRRLNKDNGFTFTVHSDAENSMSLLVPVDFRDEELLSELKRNLEGFGFMMEDGSQDIYKEGVVSEDEYYELFHYTP